MVVWFGIFFTYLEGQKKYFPSRSDYYLLPTAAVVGLAGNSRLSLFGLMHLAAASGLQCTKLPALI
jgi:hypothetical protein